VRTGLSILVGIVLVVAVTLAVAQRRFSDQVDSEVRTLLARSEPAGSAVVERSELQGLPAPVQRWLERSGVVGRERARTVRLQQTGELRTSPDGAWMPARAEQFFSVEPPAFVWKVDATMMGFLPVAGRDRYGEGRGHMLIKAASLVSVVDASDEKIDQGALLRYLAEIIWFPSAALSPRITWEAVDASSAKATLRDGWLVVSALFRFDEQGRVVGIRGERYLGGGADAHLTPWFGTLSEWGAFQGVEVPVRGEVGWALPDGDFTYYRWQVTGVELNRAEPSLAMTLRSGNARP
jgi:hypothetical protein